MHRRPVGRSRPTAGRGTVRPAPKGRAPLALHGGDDPPGGRGGWNPAARVIADSAHHMGQHLDALEAQLERSRGPWILGESFTLADVSWLPIFDRLREADSLHCFIGGGRRPAATAYWERLRERPSYRAAILDCAHPSIERGTQRLIEAKKADPALRAALEPLEDDSI